VTVVPRELLPQQGAMPRQHSGEFLSLSLPLCRRALDVRQEKGQLADRPQERVAQTLPLAKDPVLEEAWEELSPIEGHRFGPPLCPLRKAAGQGRGFEGTLEPEDVADHGPGIDSHRGVIRDDDRTGRHVGRLELTAERREGDTQAVASCLRVAIRPEHLTVPWPIARPLSDLQPLSRAPS